MTSLQCICLRRLVGFQCPCIRLQHAPSPDCDCPSCLQTALTFAAHFHCRIGGCQESFATAAAANRHFELVHIHHYDPECPCRVCAKKTWFFANHYYCKLGHLHKRR